MKLTVNGDIYEGLTQGMSVADLLAYLNLPKGKIAVEHNLAIVPKSQHASVRLSDGDTLEIIHFIGGG